MTLPTSGGAATPDELEKAKQARADRASELERVRNAAGKWQAGLAGLFALSTGLTVPSLGDTIQALTWWSGIGLAVAVVIAFILGVVATIIALRASGGIPRLVGTMTISSHPDAEAAARDLRRAINFTVAALAAAGIACGLTWFAPRIADTKSYADITAGATTACGEVDATSAPGRLLITDKDRTVHIVEVDAVTSWIIVDRCP